MMVSVTLIVYVQSNINWAIGFTIPAILMFLSVVLFFVGTRIYVRVKPEGSPLTGVVQVLVAAAKKRRMEHPNSPKLSLFNNDLPKSINSKLPHTDQFRFLDKAAIITLEDDINPDGSAVDPWRLCRMQQGEEVKCLMRVIPIWVSGIIFYTTVVQQSNYAVFQDRLIVPILRKVTGIDGGITLLQRMGIGIFISIIATLVSALIEERRRKITFTEPTLGFTKGGGAISAMSGFWLIPQLLLTGLAEAFDSVGQIEFYYKQFPENMRSIAGSFFFLTMAMANYLSGFMISVAHKTTGWLPEDLNKGRLDYYYFFVAAL
ncbi:hypothetical protein GIB67_039101, partial [Kingdonia uniflora]